MNHKGSRKTEIEDKILAAARHLPREKISTSRMRKYPKSQTNIKK